MKHKVYESCKKFLDDYPKTIAWRIKKHCTLADGHINDDEVVLFSFIGQMNTNVLQCFYTTVVIFTNKRMLLARDMLFGRYYYASITPDMLNDFKISSGFLFGAVEVDTIKEHFVISCLDKNSLNKIEDALSKYLVNEKLKMLKKDSKE